MNRMKRLAILCLLPVVGLLGCGSKEVTIKPPETQNPAVQKGVERIMQRREQQQQRMAPNPQPTQKQSQG